MTAAEGLQRLEARAAAWRRGRVLFSAGLVAIALVLFGRCWDGHRAASADGEIRILEQQTAAAQRERHVAAVAGVEARRALLVARRRADSLESSAAAIERRAQQLGRLVRVMSETSLVVQLTPTAPAIAVSVPRVVTEYIGSLQETIATKDSALAARDAQAARADTVIVTVDRQVKADTVVIDSQAQTVKAEKSARPRFGFKSGFATGAAAIALLAYLLR